MDVTPPTVILTSPVPLGARVTLPLLAEVILLPATSSAEVRALKFDGAKTVPLYLRTCPTAGLETEIPTVLPSPIAP